MNQTEITELFLSNNRYGTCITMRIKINDKSSKQKIGLWGKLYSKSLVNNVEIKIDDDNGRRKKNGLK